MREKILLGISRRSVKIINYKTLTQPLTLYHLLFVLMNMEDTFLEIRTFVLRLMAGEVMDSPEDIEFYQCWKYEIENLIKE